MKTFPLPCAVLLTCANIVHAAAPADAAAPKRSTALVAQDATALRSGPRDSAPSQATLAQGELIEVRARRLDYVQVWDYRRERGGFVHASQLRAVSLDPGEADALLAVLRFTKDNVGSEGLTLGYAAAWLKAASPQQVSGVQGAEVFDAMGTAAERLARRATTKNLPKSQQDAIAAQLEMAPSYGVRFGSTERAGNITLCYEGDAFKRVLAMPSANAEQRARAALALTRSDCEASSTDPTRVALARASRQTQAAVLDQASVQASPQGVTALTKNRLHVRRAQVWSAIAYDQARLARPDAKQAAARALDEFASIDKNELTDDDLSSFNDAAMSVNASRWAAVASPDSGATSAGLTLRTKAGETPGETCVQLMQAQQSLAQRCTYGLVWAASFSANREATGASLAVQSQATWREMWVFRKQADASWSIDVLVPAAANPEQGYVEFAGWVPGGQQMLIAREARAEGRYKRGYEVLELATLASLRQASDPTLLGAFQRWAQPQWRAHSVSVR